MICLRAVGARAGWRIGALVVLVAATACSSKEAAIPSATVPTAPAQTTTTDPYAVPAVIDTAYVNRVLAGLDAVAGDVARQVVQARTISPDAIGRLRSLYATDKRLQLEIDILQDDARTGFSGYRPNPGNQRTQVTKLINEAPHCVFAEVARDYSAVTINPVAPQRQWVALVPIDRSRDPSGYNPTPWMYAYNGFSPSGTEPTNPCAA